MKKPNESGRTRLFAFVVYPESVAADWVNILRSWHVPIFISPLHCYDIDNGTGELKKEHYHVMVMFDGVKTTKQFEELRDSVNGVGCEYIQSKRGYARYLCHLDNPEKYKYDINDVIEIGGADYNSTIQRDSDKYITINQMLDFIRSSNITSYCDLMDYARIHEPEWYYSLCNNSSFVINTYITDIRRCCSR